MKAPIMTFFVLFIGLSCFGQEIEFCSSLNTSSEQRFQSSSGIGIQYQEDIGKKFKAGLGIHYNYNNSQFENIPFVDADPNLIIVEKINSSSKRFAVRLNLQRMLKNNENASISLGPEISYNNMWGQDKIDETALKAGQTPTYSEYAQNIGLKEDIGLGLITKIEVKKVLLPPLSLCITIRPELLIGKAYKLEGMDPPVFSGVLTFTEFQIGLKYRFEQ
jgi:hypothetical protein